ncbi:Exonuclease [Paenibacillus sp. UNC496MF]|uniref:3'-5' exonuclease n=1 Tax=Paenibacillus sp. UNC496MF TaxID=1502753 RepID=UPI0008EF6E90|nr:3'-5' exonuclease [Paenibacillus sp. UNC496MF]SFJ54565.1 Exonuclease [Paenibacillus sp. UNC496MF]
MEKTILLAANLYEYNRETRLTFYCLIPDVKEGYMALNVGGGRADHAFWTGLLRVLGILHRSYKDFGLQLAIHNATLTLDGRHAEKDQVMRLLGTFASYTQRSCDPYLKHLDRVNNLSVVDHIERGELKGYSLESIHTAEASPPVVVKGKKPNAFDYYSDLAMPQEGIVLDFETTSPIVDYAKIIEISALKFRNGEIIDRFETLCNPKCKIPKQVRELTGITDVDVADKPSSFQAMKQLGKFLAGAPVLVGQNIQYDYRVLKAVCVKAHIPVWTGKLLCTMKLARQLDLAIDNYDLTTLSNTLGIHNERPHRAWADTRATFEVMQAIYRSLLL